MEHGSRPGRCPPADGTQWRGWWGSLSILSPSSCPLKPCSLCSSREGGSAGLSLSLHQGEPLQLPLTRNQLSSAIHSLQRRPGLLFSSGARASHSSSRTAGFEFVNRSSVSQVSRPLVHAAPCLACCSLPRHRAGSPLSMFWGHHSRSS